MRYPTRIVGNAALVKSVVVSTAPCVLVGYTGHNNGAADLYIQAHALSALAGGEVPIMSVLAFKGLPYAFSLPAPVGFDQLIITASTTLASYTDPTGTPVTIQALLAG